MDLPGFGQSPLPADWTNSLVQTVDAVETFLETLPYEKVSIVGNSMGAGIALAFAQRRPDRVDRIIPVNPYGLPVLPQIISMAIPFQKMSAYFLSPPVLEKTARYIYSRSFYNPERVTPSLTRDAIRPFRPLQRRKDLVRFLTAILPEAMNDIDQKLPTLCHPTHIIWGDEDRWLSRNHLDRLVERIPNCSFTRIREAGHLPHQEKPEEVFRILREFVCQAP